MPEDTGRVKNHRIELQKTRDYVNNQYADTFHAKISEERKHDLLEEVKKRRRLVTEADLKEKNTTEIRLKYQDRFQEFEDNYGPQEDRRLQALENIRSIHVMQDFLCDLSAHQGNQF